MSETGGQKGYTPQLIRTIIVNIPGRFHYIRQNDIISTILLSANKQ